LAVSNIWTYDVSILRNLGNGTFDAPVSCPLNGEAWYVAAGTWTATVGPTCGGLRLAGGSANNGDGTFAPAANYDLGDGVWYCLDIGDLNGDGWPDLAAVAGEDLKVLFNAGDGTFLEPTTCLSRVLLRGVATAT